MVTKTARRTTKIKLQLLWERGKKCEICGRDIEQIDDLTVDHIFPISKGGKNVIENCQLAHKKCNVMKGDTV